MHAVMAAPDLVGKGFRRCGQRVGVGHLKNAGHATEHGGAGARLQIFLVGQAGFAEMDLGVDHAGQDMKAACVDPLACAGLREIAYAGDAPVLDADIGLPAPVLIDECAAGEDHIEGRGHNGHPCRVEKDHGGD